MTTSKDGNNNGPRDTALAGSRPADRHSGQPFFAATYGDDENDPELSEEDRDLNDITKIHLGMLTGKAMISAMGAAVREDRQHAEEAREKKHKQELRELERLAAWNQEMTTMGGVQMTNEQAQAARRYFIEHEDEMTRLAVERGYIKPGQEEESKKLMRRMHDLKEQEGRGTLTEDGKKELREVAASPVYQGAEKAAASVSRDLGPTVQHADKPLASAKAIEATGTMPAARTADYFQAADVSGQFASASAPKPPEERKVAVAAPTPPAAKVEASGLGL